MYNSIELLCLPLSLGGARLRLGFLAEPGIDAASWGREVLGGNAVGNGAMEDEDEGLSRVLLGKAFVVSIGTGALVAAAAAA